MKSELLIGCGNSRRKKLGFSREWSNLVTIDHDPGCGADVVHDLDETPWPFADDSFDECHAYEVLEHLGTQGDYRSFFRHFHEIWRVLKDGGHLFATVPSWKSEWAWGDPSHVRVITPGTLVFLSQAEYRRQVGRTAMTDFRWLWKGDFEIAHSECDEHNHIFVLKAIKRGEDGQ
jgi:predicted SAM-dependent methyltransferase